MGGGGGSYQPVQTQPQFQPYQPVQPQHQFQPYQPVQPQPQFQTYQPVQPQPQFQPHASNAYYTSSGPAMMPERSGQYYNDGSQTIEGGTTQSGTFKGHGVGATVLGGFTATSSIQ